MTLKRSSLERQLEQAGAALAARETTLEEKGIPAKKHRRDTQWRGLNATRRKLRGRLARVGQTEALNEEVARRKAAPPDDAVKPDKKEAKSKSKKTKPKKKKKE